MKSFCYPSLTVHFLLPGGSVSMKNRPFFLLSSCSSYFKGLKKLAKTCHLNLFVLLAIFGFPNLLQALPGPCLTTATGDPNLNCTAHDVMVTHFNVLSGPSFCVIGTTINVQIQAVTESTGNNRYDVGYWISTVAGENALNGTACYDDYLPPP